MTVEKAGEVLKVLGTEKDLKNALLPDADRIEK
jgi:hypothetical protein